MWRLCLLLPAVLASCGSVEPLHAVAATADGVTFEYAGDRQVEAAKRATLYCANLGRNAMPRDIRHDGGDLSIAVFDCR